MLDEPSIGLHQRDNERLIGTLKKLRDLGNTVGVVEHDEDNNCRIDYLLDIGPELEFMVVKLSEGTQRAGDKNPKSITVSTYGSKTIKAKSHIRQGNGKGSAIRGRFRGK